MNTILKTILLIALDFILIWLWLDDMKPDVSSSIIIIILVPFVFLLNLIIGVILYFSKKKTFAVIFLVNAFVSSIIMVHLFDYEIDRGVSNSLDQWEFQKADTTFS